MIAKLRFGDKQAPPPRHPRDQFNDSLPRGRAVRSGESVNLHNIAPWRDHHVEIVVLEKETLPGVSCGKGEPQTVAAIESNPLGREAIAECFDVDLPCLRGPR